MFEMLPLLVLCLPMLSATCAPDASPRSAADAFRCVMPACVDRITEQGMLEVRCQAPDRCEGEELRRYDANMSDALGCIHQVWEQLRPCVEPLAPK